MMQMDQRDIRKLNYLWACPYSEQTPPVLNPHQKNSFHDGGFTIQEWKPKNVVKKKMPYLPNDSEWLLQSSLSHSCHWTVLSHPPSRPAQPAAAPSRASIHKGFGLCQTLLEKGKRFDKLVLPVPFLSIIKFSHFPRRTWTSIYIRIYQRKHSLGPSICKDTKKFYDLD